MIAYEDLCQALDRFNNREARPGEGVGQPAAEEQPMDAPAGEQPVDYHADLATQEAEIIEESTDIAGVVVSADDTDVGAEVYEPAGEAEEVIQSDVTEEFDIDEADEMDGQEIKLN